MSPQTRPGVPTTLKIWLQELVRSIPARSTGTLLELLFGTLLSERGLISQAVLMIAPRRGWPAYYWLVERARLPWIALVRALCGIVEREFPERRRCLIVDDVLILRTSATAPDAAVRFDHVQRANRPRHVLCQMFVWLAAAITDHTGRTRAVPLLAFPVKAAGHPGRLVLAKALLGTVLAQFHTPLVLLVDAWYMRRRLVLWAVQRGLTVIGQIRRDSALFRPPDPPPPGRRGRPRKYGARITAADLATVPLTEKETAAYGGRVLRWRGMTCRPRFLRGLESRVVWVAMRRQEGWAKERLLLSTDPTLDDEAIILEYARRWAVEPMLRDLKWTEGLREMWMQGRKTLLRWLHIVQAAAALAVLLAARADPELDALARIGGWRRETRPSTPGLVKKALAGAFVHFAPLPLLGAGARSAPKSRRTTATGPPPIPVAA
jgi:DDE superfamily endonuclease